MNFSAKELLSRSATQMRFFINNPSKKPKATPNMVAGCDYQNKLAKRMPNVIGQELGGKLMINSHNIYFSNDIVCNNSIIEVKQINGEYNDWFLEHSLIQCAAYKALVKLTNGYLSTSKFYAKLNNEYQQLKINLDLPYYLFFGEKIFKITDVNESIFLRYLTSKINAILASYDDAKLFDKNLKGKEFNILNKYFKYIQVK